MSSKLDLSVVTITYNERENIRLFIETVNQVLSSAKLRGEIIVVDDSSPDRTDEVVLELKQKYPSTMLIKRPGKLGIGSAYHTGALAAQGRVVAFLDADLSHPPALLPEMQALADTGSIVFGSRYLGGTAFETDIPHVMGTFLLNTWVRWWLRTGMKDHTNGYVVMPKKILYSILNDGEEKKLRPFDHILYGITIAALARSQGVPTREVKAVYHKRVHGETKIPFWSGLKVVVGDMWYTLRVFSRLR